MKVESWKLKYQQIHTRTHTNAEAYLYLLAKLSHSTSYIYTKSFCVCEYMYLCVSCVRVYLPKSQSRWKWRVKACFPDQRSSQLTNRLQYGPKPCANQWINENESNGKRSSTPPDVHIRCQKLESAQSTAQQVQLRQTLWWSVAISFSWDQPKKNKTIISPPLSFIWKWLETKFKYGTWKIFEVHIQCFSLLFLCKKINFTIFSLS